MILSVPARKNGRLISLGRANMRPTRRGLSAAPMVRATPVMPPAAARSAGDTTAMTYDCLAGTSIWLMLNRTRSTTAADHNDGISGTRISRMFEGRCVNTIVLIRPMRAASRDASSAENPAKMFAEEDRAKRRDVDAKPQVKPVGEERLDDEAASERVQRKQSGKLEDDGSRAIESREPTDERRRRPRVTVTHHLGPVRKSDKDRREHNPQGGVDDDHRPVAADRRDGRVVDVLRDHAREQRPECGRQ